MIGIQRSNFILFYLVFLIISCQPTEKKTSQIASDLQRLTEKVKSDSTNPAVYAERAAYYRLHKGFDEAILDYRKAIELDDQKPEYFFDLADTHMDYLDALNARVTMDAAVKQFPDDVEARLKMARLLIILREYDEVAQHLQRAKMMDPFNAEVEYARGVYFLDQKRPDAAVKAFRAAVELDDQLVDGWTALGEIAADNKDPEALTFYKNALLIEPDNINALHAQAYYLQNAERIDEAIEIYTRINEIDSTYEWSYFNRAILHMERDQMDEAEDLLKKCIVHKPKMTVAHYYIGIIREKQGRIDEALQFYRNALAADPNFTRAQEAVDDLTKKGE